MGVSSIVVSIDREIALLKQVRALLSGSAVATPKKAAPKLIAVAAEVAPTKRRKKRKLSPEGRKRIAEAVKRRWEAQRKAAAASK
jgi:hypothetical protein